MKEIIKFNNLFLKVLAPCLFLFTNIYKPNIIFADQNIKNKLENYTNISNYNFYILGPGDLLNINVKDNANLLNKPFKIDGEGIVNLPRLKRLYVAGLTIDELTNILNDKYSKFVKNPDVNLTIVKYRPVGVFISGEVENPGFYVLQGESESENIPNNLLINKTKFQDKYSTKFSNSLDEVENKNFFPSLFFAIRKSGGVTLNANLKDVLVTRKDSITNGSGKIQTSLNLIDAISSRDLKQNIRLHDGDSIFIPKSDNPILSEITKATQTNLNPKFISVLLTGRFNDPGRISINRGATLLETIDIAGGTKAIKGNLVFLRYNSNGNLEKRKFKLKKSAKKGSFKNPVMKNGDIIYIEKGAWGSTTEILKDITSPLESLLSTVGIYKLVTGD